MSSSFVLMFSGDERLPMRWHYMTFLSVSTVNK